ncbi:hypothetical protein F-S17_0189 [Faustovirus]|nr:hypothetical protein F-S17_0189 [Faustovirus]
MNMLIFCYRVGAMMSLCNVPNDVIIDIYKYLLRHDRDFGVSLLTLALACRRFYGLLRKHIVCAYTPNLCVVDFGGDARYDAELAYSRETICELIHREDISDEFIIGCDNMRDAHNRYNDLHSSEWSILIHAIERDFKVFERVYELYDGDFGITVNEIRKFADIALAKNVDCYKFAKYAFALLENAAYSSHFDRTCACIHICTKIANGR